MWKTIQSGHKFAHVMTAQLSWHVQICDLIVSSKLKLDNFHKISVISSLTLCVMGPLSQKIESEMVTKTISSSLWKIVLACCLLPRIVYPWCWNLLELFLIVGPLCGKSCGSVGVLLSVGYAKRLPECASYGDRSDF